MLAYAAMAAADGARGIAMTHFAPRARRVIWLIMPAFIVMPDPGGGLKGCPAAWRSGYLPATYQGVTVRSGTSPIKKKHAQIAMYRQADACCSPDVRIDEQLRSFRGLMLHQGVDFNMDDQPAVD